MARSPGRVKNRALHALLLPTALLSLGAVPAAASLTCQAYAYKPAFHVHYTPSPALTHVHGRATDSCSSTSPVEEHNLIVTVQIHAWGPVWNNLHRESAPLGFGQATLEYTLDKPCAADQVEDYRTVADTYANNQQFDQWQGQDVSNIYYDYFCAVPPPPT